MPLNLHLVSKGRPFGTGIHGPDYTRQLISGESPEKSRVLVPLAKLGVHLK